MSRRVNLVMAAALGVALATGCSPTSVPEAPTDAPATDVRTGRDPDIAFTVNAQDLGMHSFTSQPQVPTAAIRLNCSPAWSTVEPAPGDFDWAAFDDVVSRAEEWGYQDIIYVFCATPAWAGEAPTGPDSAIFGPGTAQPPADMNTFAAFVAAVADRYRDRIDGYEVWNEPTSPQFFTGSPQQIAAMTEIVHRVVEDVAPGAYVLSAGVQTQDPASTEEFIDSYYSELRTRGWPVDVVSGHFYPEGQGSPEARVRQIRWMQQKLRQHAAPADIPLWDTEVNYLVDRPGGMPDGRVSGQRAAAWTVQSYLDGWRTGVRRTYWYLWTADYYRFPGIQMRPGDPSTLGLQTLGSWVIGARFDGCDDTADGVVRCHFDQSGKAFDIAYATKGDTPITVASPTVVCPLIGAECRQVSDSMELSELPVRIG